MSYLFYDICRKTPELEYLDSSCPIRDRVRIWMNSVLFMHFIISFWLKLAHHIYDIHVQNGYFPYHNKGKRFYQ